MTIWEAIALVVATGVATYATYDICINQGHCDRLAIDVERALGPNHTGSPPASLPPSNPPGFPVPQETPLEVNGFPLGDAEALCTPGGFSTLPPEIQQFLQNPQWYPSENGAVPTVFQSAALPSRSEAFGEAKRDAGIPISQAPDRVDSVPLTDRNGQPILDANKQRIMTREYVYTRPNGSQIVIQEHSLGHDNDGVGDQLPHWNVRPITNRRTGKVPGTKEHYYFQK